MSAEALLNVAVSLRRGEFTLEVRFAQPVRITGVFGHSGAGKSTLLLAIAGLLKPDSGAITLGDVTLFDSEKGISLPPHKRRVGYVFQDDRLLPHYSVTGNLRYGMRGTREGGPISFDEVIDLLDLRPLMDRPIEGLSGGERQRIALGRALLSRPRLLLFDEPLAGLDARLRGQILPYLARVRDVAQIPMLFVSHRLEEMLALTDQVLVIERGRSIGCGHVPDLVQDTAPREVLHSLGLLNVLTLPVSRHDREAGLTYLSMRGSSVDGSSTAELAAPLLHSDEPLATVAIRPQDIALATSRLEGVSIQNQLPARVTRMTEHHERVIVEVDAGATLLVEVSRKTVREMTIATAREVWCLIKSNAVRRL